MHGETFLYLRLVIQLIGQCLIGEVLWYDLEKVAVWHNLDPVRISSC